MSALFLYLNTVKMLFYKEALGGNTFKCVLNYSQLMQPEDVLFIGLCVWIVLVSTTTCFVCSGPAYEIYSRGDPST